MPDYDEESPLLGTYTYTDNDTGSDTHHQFCLLVGVPPSNLREGQRKPPIVQRSLYGRATRRRKAQNATYLFTAALSNTLLLTQVVLGAALTALGASASSHILITVFGALNTIIAGLVAYLKSRGQPMRARMFRDDLDRVVDEIENSEVMWLGISRGVHGYDEIAIDDTVSVRSEVARLTRLYDKAVRSNTMNDPDMYMNAVGAGGDAALRARPGQPALPPANAAPAASPSPAAGGASTPAAQPAPPVPVADPDASPATAPPKAKEEPPKAIEAVEPKTPEEVPDATNARKDSLQANGPVDGTANASSSANTTVKEEEGDA